MRFRLRVAQAADTPSLVELIAASVRQLQPQYSAEQREAAIATVFSIDSRLIADGTYLLSLADDGRLAGCGGWSRRKTLFGGDHQVGASEPELLDPARDAAKIRAIFVHPDFARMGLGSLILEAAEQAAVHAGFARFEMGSTLAGLSLYRHYRYEERERLEVPVGSGETITVVRMVKEEVLQSIEANLTLRLP